MSETCASAWRGVPAVRALTRAYLFNRRARIRPPPRHPVLVEWETEAFDGAASCSPSLRPWTVDHAFMAALIEYPFPGNVREEACSGAPWRFRLDKPGTAAC